MIAMLVVAALLAGSAAGMAVVLNRLRDLATKCDVAAIRTAIRHDQIVLTRLLRDEIRKKT